MGVVSWSRIGVGFLAQNHRGAAVQDRRRFLIQNRRRFLIQNRRRLLVDIDLLLAARKIVDEVVAIRHRSEQYRMETVDSCIDNRHAGAAAIRQLVRLAQVDDLAGLLVHIGRGGERVVVKSWGPVKLCHPGPIFRGFQFAGGFQPGQFDQFPGSAVCTEASIARRWRTCCESLPRGAERTWISAARPAQRPDDARDDCASATWRTSPFTLTRNRSSPKAVADSSTARHTSLTGMWRFFDIGDLPFSLLLAVYRVLGKTGLFWPVNRKSASSAEPG